MKTLLDPTQKRKQLERLKKLKPGTVPGWGILTAGNLLPHLTDPFKIALGEMEAIPVHSFLNTGIGRFVAIYLMPRWPKGAPTHPKTNILLKGRQGGDFEKDRAELVNAVKRFTQFYAKISYQAHPIFGKISNRTWGIVMNKHLDHHFRQFGI